MTYNTFIIILSIFFTIIQAYVSMNYIKSKKYPQAIENIIIYFSYLLFIYLQYKFNFRVEIFIIFITLISVLCHSFIGEYFDLYHKISIYDKILHSFGTFSFTIFCYSIISKTLMPVVTPPIFITLFIINLGVSLGVLFELIEFTVDCIFKTTSQTDLKDTDIDLISDIIGAVAAGLIYWKFI